MQRSSLIKKFGIGLFAAFIFCKRKIINIRIFCGPNLLYYFFFKALYC